MTAFVKNAPANKIGVEIDRYCDAHNLSIRQFASAVGVDEALISFIRSGRKRATMRTVDLLRQMNGTDRIVDECLLSMGVHPVADRLNRVIQTNHSDESNAEITNDVTYYLDTIGAPK